MNSFVYYVAGLILLIIGFLIAKKVASCMVRAIVTLVLVVALAAVYYIYLRQ